MKDFFTVMGKAFAVVFGSTLAFALVLVLLVLALRPVLRPWSRETPANSPVDDIKQRDNRKPDPDCIKWDNDGRCTQYGPWAKYRANKPESSVLRLCREFNEKGQCADPTADEWNLSLGDCSKDGCFVYSGDLIVGYISHKQLMNMNEPQHQHQPGFTPVQPFVKK